jgi:hypothetical protein
MVVHRTQRCARTLCRRQAHVIGLNNQTRPLRVANAFGRNVLGILILRQVDLSRFVSYG